MLLFWYRSNNLIFLFLIRYSTQFKWTSISNRFIRAMSPIITLNLKPSTIINFNRTSSPSNSASMVVKRPTVVDLNPLDMDIFLFVSSYMTKKLSENYFERIFNTDP